MPNIPSSMTNTQSRINKAELKKVTFYLLQETFMVTSSTPINMDMAHPTQDTTFLDQWNIIQRTSSDIQILIQAILNGQAVAVSNGSFMDNSGIVAWTIEGQNATHCLTGTGITPGAHTDQSAYRSELFGLWGIMYLLLQLTKEYKIMQGKVVIACDGLLALWQVTKTTTAVDPGLSHYEQWAYRGYQKHLTTITPSNMWKITKDKGLPMAHTWLASMNIKMDVVAKERTHRTQAVSDSWQQVGVLHKTGMD